MNKTVIDIRKKLKDIELFNTLDDQYSDSHVESNIANKAFLELMFSNDVNWFSGFNWLDIIK